MKSSSISIPSLPLYITKPSRLLTVPGLTKSARELTAIFRMAQSGCYVLIMLTRQHVSPDFLACAGASSVSFTRRQWVDPAIVTPLLQQSAHVTAGRSQGRGIQSPRIREAPKNLRIVAGGVP